MNSEKDSVIPKDKWEFDESVTACFDDMLERSIPAYKFMRKTCEALALSVVNKSYNLFTTAKPIVIDLGASRGEAIYSLAQKLPNTTFYAVEISKPMLEVLNSRFSKNENMIIMDRDLKKAHEFLPSNASVIMSVLTLQFTPIEYRQYIVQSIYNSLKPGGAFILVEKVLGASPNINELFVQEYYGFKTENGYSYEDIQRKKASLEGVLVPITAEWNQQLLTQAGFKDIDCFYRCLNFAGWIAFK